MKDLSPSSGPVFTEDDRINLYYLNELYAHLAQQVSGALQEAYGFHLPLTSGIWGGTYLIADPAGNSRRRIWRLYCIVNLPQNSPLDRHENLERLIAVYSSAFHQAFKPYDLDLELKMWGGRLPYSCRQKPSFTFHMADNRERVRWLRAFFVWNPVPWEESLIYDLVRIVKEYKQYFDIHQGPVDREAQEIKYILQDIIIIYKSLEHACSDDFREHAEPIIQDLMEHFLAGLHDPAEIQALYRKVFNNYLIYGYEETLEGPYRRAGLNIHCIDEWPVEKINWVPQELKNRLIPPIRNLFARFKANLDKASSV